MLFMSEQIKPNASSEIPQSNADEWTRRHPLVVRIPSASLAYASICNVIIAASNNAVDRIQQQDPSMTTLLSTVGAPALMAMAFMVYPKS